MPNIRAVNQDATLTRERENGLGLSICKGIWNHDRTITVKSTSKQETIFIFTLPKKAESGKDPMDLLKENKLS